MEGAPTVTIVRWRREQLAGDACVSRVYARCASRLTCSVVVAAIWYEGDGRYRRNGTVDAHIPPGPLSQNALVSARTIA